MKSALVLLLCWGSGCGRSASHPAAGDGQAPLGDATAGAADSPTGATDAAPPAPLAVVGSQQLCKLLSNRNTSDPTANDVQHRANLLGADLGIPVAYADHLYVMFGDSIGFAGIWKPGESHPDAVGYAGDAATAVAADPALLCSDLHIATLPPAQSIGPGVDSSVVADFAGAAMAAPSGGALATFIHNPAGGQGATFANLPGDFEVPSGSFAYGDSIYVLYTTVISSAQPTMTASYLARWTQPTPGALPDYQILYAIDERVDASGPLHGHFINIAAQVSGDYVYLFGTGAYRASPIYLARKRLDSLATPGGFEELGTVAPTPGYGETSVRYFAETGQWLLLAEELQPTTNRIVAYVANAPTGPWVGPTTVHDMADPSFEHTYCCAVDDDCEGAEMFDCDRTGFYGSYLLPTARASAGQVTVAYTLSSFAPYNVALFETTFSD